MVSNEAVGPSSAPTAGLRSSRARGTRTHDRLRVAGYELFAHKGYEGTSIGDVAALAGVGVGTVYHHFADKRALLLDVLDGFEAQGQLGDSEGTGALGQALQEPDPEAAIRATVRVAVGLVRRRPSLYPTAVELGRRDPDVAACCARIESGHRERLRRAIELGQRLGKVRPEIDPGAVALVLQSLVQSAIPRIAREPHPEAAIESLAELVCRMILES